MLVDNIFEDLVELLYT